MSTPVPTPADTGTTQRTERPSNKYPTSNPSLQPSLQPILVPTIYPSVEPGQPTFSPSTTPTENPSIQPSIPPSMTPSVAATLLPSRVPSVVPSVSPTFYPTFEPSLRPVVPSLAPTAHMPTQLSTTLCARDRTQYAMREDNNDIFVDIDGGGVLSTGDIFVFDRSNLTTPGFPRGYTSGHCVVLEDVNRMDNVYCTMNFDFPEGSIALQGVFLSTTVVGGTECYADLHGSASPRLERGTFIHRISKDNGRDCPSEWWNTTWFEKAGDTFVDTDRSRSATPGDMFCFDGNDISVGSQNDETVGTVAGVCFIMPQVDEDTFCLVSFTFASNNARRMGTLTAMGLFSSMTITGGTGCFVGLTGRIGGGSHTNGFAYTLTIDDDEIHSNCTKGILDEQWVEIGNDIFIDFNGDKTASPGEIYLIENHTIRAGPLLGNATGHCVVLDGSTERYCRLTFLFEEGTLAVIGFFSQMVIVGASGCFHDFQNGVMRGSDEEASRVYSLSINS